MLRFEYFVQYDHYSPEDNDDRVTDEVVVAAFSRFREALRSIAIAADPDATVETVPMPPNQPTMKWVFVTTNLDAGTVDESVQRCARRYHLKAALLGCT